MPITNEHVGTRIDEIADRIYRISTPIPPSPDMPPGFTFNQFLIDDDEPLLFHTGMRKLFPAIRDAVATVMAVEKLRWISFSHHECDEDGSLAEWLAAAPHATTLCGRLGAMYSVEDATARVRVLADNAAIAIGKMRVQWLDTAHVPHGWDAGMLFETTTRTLFCTDVLAQPGHQHDAVTERDVLEPSEAMRGAFDYYSNPTARRPCSSASPRRSQHCSPRCTGLRIAATVAPCCARLLRACGGPHEPRPLYVRARMGTSDGGTVRAQARSVLAHAGHLVRASA